MQRFLDSLTFGDYLRQLRRRAGLTQIELGQRVGLSGAHISRLEKNLRRPDVETLSTQFNAALELHAEPDAAARLIELAALARGERPPSSTSPAAVAGEFPHSWPVPPHPMLGREREMAKICDRLLDRGGRLLTLIGPPGVGKTRLALAAVACVRHAFAGGACFVSLAEISDPAHLAPAVLAAMGVPLDEAYPSTEQLLEALQRKELLLVLDNFEHLAPAAPMVGEWLARCPRLRLLVTSRAALRLRAEQRLRVHPLPLAAAVELLTHRAQLVDEEFELTEFNRPEVELLVQRLDCLPLAIELIAAHLEVMSLPALVERLEAGVLDLLENGSADLPARHRSLRRAIQHSYDLLNEGERQLLWRLCRFDSPFGLEAIHAFGAEEGALQRLVQSSLVNGETDDYGQRSFWMLETIRDFAREQLVVHDDLINVAFAYHTPMPEAVMN